MNDEMIRDDEGLQQDIDLQEDIQEEIQEDIQEELTPEADLEENTPEEVAGTEDNSEENPNEESDEEPEEQSEEQLEEQTEEGAQENADEDAIEKIMKKPPYHERYYLNYCGGQRTAPVDLEGTKKFLQSLGFDGGELRQAREGKGQAEIFQNADKNKQSQMYCSYCGSEISGVEYYRLPDGRLRCTACSRSIVSDKEEIQAMCQRVISNMEQFFHATIDVPVSVEVVEERKLKKKLGLSIGTKDSQSMLILGVAINKKKKYQILIENGAPRISLIATFAHELTHIWQYTHWDNVKKFEKCPKDKRLLIYEGMAKWAEIQYLYLIGETGVARREEIITRNRQDEYGIGFCLYEEQYPLCRETMTCEETPFTPERYPLGK